MFNPKSKVIEQDMKEMANELKEYYAKISGKTFLITGGAGFLGRYLVSILDYLNFANLLEKPCKIILVDNFITGIKDWIIPGENLILINQDITKPLKIDGEVDYIIHAASLASPKFYYKYRLETINVGIAGTTNMLELAKEKNVKSFLFTSSSEVYGNPDSIHIPTDEEYWGNVSCIGPRACYDEPKRIGETLCVNYADVYNIPVKIVRPFNVFGPGMRLDDGRVLANFVLAAIKGEKIPVYGDGQNTRTFCYIANFIVGLYQILFSNYNREPFNVGADYPEINMKNLADIVLYLVENRDTHVEVITGPSEVYTKSNPDRRCPNLTKARLHINYEPKIGLIPGITRYIEWVKEELQNQNEEKNCRLCGNTDLKNIISLGKTPLANSLLTKEELTKEKGMYPLEVMYCSKCHNCQLSYIVPRDELFKSYPYVTSTTKTFRDHFGKMAEDITKEYNLGNQSLVVDIGSNDGLLLKNFNEFGINTIGVEPARNIAEIAIKNGVKTIVNYFNDESVNEIIKSEGYADIITANNVFAHTKDLENMVFNVKKLLKGPGIFIIEVQYLLDTIKNLTFDNIYHEHIHYFSLFPLKKFFEKNGMEIFNVQHIDSHGGSIRVFIQKKGGSFTIKESVNEFLEGEKAFGLDRLETYESFAKKVYHIKDTLNEYIKKIKSENKRIVGYGAPAKATTLLNFCGIKKDEIDYIVDDNPLKQGLIVPGVKIPIKNREYLETSLPDYILILAWNFAEEIIKNNEAYKEKGVKFIIPLPNPKIV
jgi:nucleoside-diphosphate-sugar epimerase/SAM-dependent methyltransferase